MSHPIQPIADDGRGVLRFKENAIVRYLLDSGPFDLNHLARRGFTQEDAEQFAQLIGYSLSGFADLSYVSDETYAAACALAEDSGRDEKEARIAYLQGTLDDLRSALREPVAEPFGIHPDDLGKSNG